MSNSESAVPVVVALRAVAWAWRGDWSATEVDGRDGRDMLELIAAAIERGDATVDMGGEPICVEHQSWPSHCSDLHGPDKSTSTVMPASPNWKNGLNSSRSLKQRRSRNETLASPSLRSRKGTPAVRRGN